MKTIRRQQGYSLWSLLVIAVVLGFFALLALRLIPVYMDYWTVVSVAESVQEDPELRDGSPREARSALRARMRLNNLRDYDVGDLYSISRGDGGVLVIDIEYEKRVPFMLNIDLVASFERRVGP